MIPGCPINHPQRTLWELFYKTWTRSSQFESEPVCSMSALVLKECFDPRALHRFHPLFPPRGSWMMHLTRPAGDGTHRVRVRAHHWTEITEKITDGGRVRGKDVSQSFLVVTGFVVSCHWSTCQLWLTSRKDVLHPLWCQLSPLIDCWSLLLCVRGFCNCSLRMIIVRRQTRCWYFSQILKCTFEHFYPKKQTGETFCNWRNKSCLLLILDS